MEGVGHRSIEDRVLRARLYRVGVDGEDVADADLGLLVVEASGYPKSPAGSPDEAGQGSEVEVVPPFHPGDLRLTDVQLRRHLLLGQPTELLGWLLASGHGWRSLRISGLRHPPQPGWRSPARGWPAPAVMRSPTLRRCTARFCSLRSCASALLDPSPSMAVSPWWWPLSFVAMVFKPAQGHRLAEQLHRGSEERDGAGTGARCGSYEPAAVAFSLGAILNWPLTTPRSSTTRRRVSPIRA